MTYAAFIASLTAAWALTVGKLRAFSSLVTAQRWGVAQTEGVAEKLNDWASVLNNAVWCGGTVLLLEVMKNASKVEGFTWVCVSILQVVLMMVALALIFAAVFVAIDRLGDRLTGWTRGLSSVIIVGVTGLGCWGLVNMILFHLDPVLFGEAVQSTH